MAGRPLRFNLPPPFPCVSKVNQALNPEITAVLPPPNFAEN